MTIRITRCVASLAVLLGSSAVWADPPLTIDPGPASAPAPTDGNAPPAATRPAEKAPTLVLSPMETAGTSSLIESEEIMRGTRLTRGGLRFTMNIFGLVAFSAGTGLEHGPPDGGLSTGFQAISLVPLMSARLGEHLFALVEPAFEASIRSGVGVDLERIQVGWRKGRFFVTAGRTHTELGYWNTAYHHGFWLQPTILRPRIIRFEDQGGRLPVHSVGIVGGAGFDIGESGGMNFVLGISNGRGDVPDDVRMLSDTNNWKAVTVKIEMENVGARGLRFGVSGLYDRIAPLPGMSTDPNQNLRENLPDVEIQEVIANAYLAYRGSRLTLIAEGNLIRHFTDKDTFQTYGAFAVAALRFGIVSPVLSVEYLDNDGKVDPFFHPHNLAMHLPDPGEEFIPERFVEGIVGLRIETGSWSAIKVEGRITHPLGKGLPDMNNPNGIDLPGAWYSGTVNWGFGI